MDGTGIIPTAASSETSGTHHLTFFTMRGVDAGREFNKRPRYACPHLDILVGQSATPTAALIDSGADFSCISDAFHDKLLANGEVFPEIPVVGVRIITATGQRSQRVKRQCLLSIKCHDVDMDIKALVVPNLVKDIVLGSDWLSDNKAVLGYRAVETHTIAAGERELKLQDGRCIYVLAREVGGTANVDDAPPPPRESVAVTSPEIMAYVRTAWEESVPDVHQQVMPPPERETAVKQVWSGTDNGSLAASSHPHVCAPVTYTNGKVDPESECAHPHSFYNAARKAQEWWLRECQ